MRIDHFIYSVFDGENYSTKESLGVKNLPLETYEYLQHIGDKVTGETYLQAYFPSEAIFSFSYIRLTEERDRYHRPYIWNHTIIISFSDYLEVTNPFNIFKPYFITGFSEHLKERLEQLKIGE